MVSVVAEGGVACSTVDMMLCAIALRLDVPIFTTDPDFTRYARVLHLHVVSAEQVNASAVVHLLFPLDYFPATQSFSARDEWFRSSWSTNCFSVNPQACLPPLYSTRHRQPGTNV